MPGNALIIKHPETHPEPRAQTCYDQTDKSCLKIVSCRNTRTNPHYNVVSQYIIIIQTNIQLYPQRAKLLEYPSKQMWTHMHAFNIIL